jgi:hypothetical protein
MATSCVAARQLRSWRPIYHDHAKGSPVTSTRAQEEAGIGPSRADVLGAPPPAGSDDDDT